MLSRFIQNLDLFAVAHSVIMAMMLLQFLWKNRLTLPQKWELLDDECICFGTSPALRELTYDFCGQQYKLAHVWKTGEASRYGCNDLRQLFDLL